MSQKHPSDPPGRNGCIFQANEARSYGQFMAFNSAYLFYDFVLIYDLARATRLNAPGDPHGKPVMLDLFEETQKLGIGIDPKSFLSFSELQDLDAFRSGFATDEIARERIADLLALNAETVRSTKAIDDFLDALKRKGHGDADGTTIHVPLNRTDEQFALVVDQRNAVSKRDLFIYKTMMERRGYRIDDGRWAIQAADDNQTIREVLVKGHLPISPQSAIPAGALHGDDAFRTFALVLKSVPLPSDMPPDEFVAFRNSPVVRKSIGRFRQLAEDLIGAQAPAGYVVEEILDRYSDYKTEVARLKARSQFVTVKFVISNLAGFVEDIIKLRFESLVKRPFEIAEFFIDKKYRDTSYQASPFFFLIEKDMSVDPY